MPGVNESKHCTPYAPEELGFEGAWIAGRRTRGDHFVVSLDGPLRESFARWRASDETLDELKRAMQGRLGEHNLFVESVRLVGNEGAGLDVSVRLLLDADDEEVKATLCTALDACMRELTIADPDRP